MRAWLAVVLVLVSLDVRTQEPVRLFAAGSLRAAMTELMAASGIPAQGTFGPSGLLRERIEKGEGADVFASADMGHPQKLVATGRAGSVERFTRNQLCALASPRVKMDSAQLLERMLDPAVKLGISTPKADPSGDYAFALFGKADALQAGARARLEAKALQLTGGPASPKPAAGRSIYGLLVSEGKADIFLTYCTNALEARREFAALQIVQVPPELAVGADYGLTVLNGARAGAAALAQYILGAEGQAILTKYGFSAR